MTSEEEINQFIQNYDGPTEEEYNEMYTPTIEKNNCKYQNN